MSEVETATVAWHEPALFDAPPTRERVPLPALLVDVVVRVPVLLEIEVSHEAVAALGLDEFARASTLNEPVIDAMRKRKAGWRPNQGQLLRALKDAVASIDIDFCGVTYDYGSLEPVTSWDDLLHQARHPLWRDVPAPTEPATAEVGAR